VLAAALARALWISVRERTPVWAGRGAIGMFLILIGLQAGIVYAVSRCGRLEPDTVRYALLMLYTGVGIATLFFVYETQRLWRGAMIGAIVLWAVVTAASHVRLYDEYLRREPAFAHRELAAYLVDHDIAYARADYWTAYVTTFLANEKVVLASTDTVRITSYQHAVEQNRDRAVNVQRQPCSNGQGAEAVAGAYWVCR
jgi:hypothetical protein